MKSIITLFNSYFTPWLVLGLSLTITFQLWQAEQKTTEQKVEARFQQETRTIENAIIDRLEKYELMLQGCLGLFNASNVINRREWKMYVQALDPLKNYPGLQGIGFGQRVPDAEKESHIRRLRAEGFPSYSIWPKGTRAEYFPVIYLEPFSDRNLRAFGYDMFSEPIRRAAMQEARDRGVTTMSGKVRLVQETAQNVQAGFLIYLPLYEKNQGLDTQKKRSAALRGFVYSPFRMDNFINGLINWNPAAVQWEVYDGPEYDADALLYHSGAAGTDTTDADPALHKKSSCKLFGRTWSLRFRALPAFTASVDRSMLQFMLLACLTISFLLFGITFLIVTRGKALARDMARQKLAAEALQKSKNGLLDILDATPFPIALVDTEDNKINFWSHSAFTLFGHTAPTTSEWYEMAYPDPDYRREVTERWKPALQKARLSGQAVDAGEYRVTCSDGSVRICKLYAAFIGDKLIVTFNDITERKQAEDERQASNDELIRFNYTVSHDLKAPLVTIKTFLGYLEQNMAAGDTKTAAKDMNYIHTAADKMNDLLEDLLNLSRIGRVVNLCVEAPIQEIAQEALALVAGKIAEQGVRVTITQKNLMLYGDRMRLVEVFQNLVDNAATFMGDQTEPLIEIGAEMKDESIVCYVRDNGMGIDPRHKHKLFGLFEKLDVNTKGTGIGLALVKRIVEIHGGSIWVESDGPGKGACFWFTLPRKNSES